MGVAWAKNKAGSKKDIDLSTEFERVNSTRPRSVLEQNLHQGHPHRLIDHGRGLGHNGQYRQHHPQADILDNASFYFWIDQPAMKLLIGNDDGIFAAGIQTLANTLAAAGHEVTVVCPDRERSATGHGLTIHQPIRAEQVDHLFDPQVRAWACSGTPSDCIKLAFGALLDSPPTMCYQGLIRGRTWARIFSIRERFLRLWKG